MHRVSPGLFSSLGNECIRVLRDATQIVVQFPQWPQRLCPHFLFFLGSSLSSAIYLVVHQPYDAGTDTHPELATCFLLFFLELTLGRMPIFTRPSRARTLQIISARLSENGTMVTFASDACVPRHTSTS